MYAYIILCKPIYAQNSHNRLYAVSRIIALKRETKFGTSSKQEQRYTAINVFSVQETENTMSTVLLAS
jgi:hypothetical protein